MKITSFLYLPSFLGKIIQIRKVKRSTLFWKKDGSRHNFNDNIRTLYHCNYEGFQLNDKSATLFTENIFSALNKAAQPQTGKENSSNDIRAKENAFTSTKSIKAIHPKNLFFGHVNINYIRNRFFNIQELIKGTFDIFLINETEIDDSLPNSQIKTEGYKSYKRSKCLWRRTSFLRLRKAKLQTSGNFPI